MLQKLKFSLLSIMSLLGFALPLTLSATASAAIDPPQVSAGLCSGANGDLKGNNTQGCTDETAGNAANKLVANVINILSVIVGIVAVIMIIYAGFRYVSSGGREESVKGAKNTILYAIIGLVIVALAQIIVHFVLAKTTAATTP
jgi:heme/copper-type cytochrome/quinol oxidase subunit 2